MTDWHVPIASAAGNAGQAESAAHQETTSGVEQKWLEFFGLDEQPFGVTPDPRFLYLSAQHRQALAALNYGTELNRGFLTLIAPPGLGKTSVLFSYLEGLRNHTRNAFVFQTDCDSRELLAYALADLGIKPAGQDLPALRAALNEMLTEQMQLGRRFVLVIDEAQNLKDEVLESVRLLSNFETPWMKLMQIVLAGQPELADRLSKPSLAQLKQRVSLEATLAPLSAEETLAYVDHRLWVAGYKGGSLFSSGAKTLLAESSGGVPRKINNLCFCAMSLAWATNLKTIDRETMQAVVDDKPKVPASEVHAAMEQASPATVPIMLSAPAIEPAGRAVATGSAAEAAVLTVKEHPKRGWLPKAMFATAAAVALAWAGMHAGFPTRAINYFHYFHDQVMSGKDSVPAGSRDAEQIAPQSPPKATPEIDSETKEMVPPDSARDGANAPDASAAH